MKGKLLVVAVIIAALCLLSWGEPSARAAGLQPRSPILIDGNGNFTSANGVVGGTGTATSPYLIQGWDIYVDNWADGIRVENTDAYFAIRNVYLHSGAPNYNNGVILQNVSHATVENDTFYAQWVAVELDGSTNSSVFNNTISGVQGSIFTAGEYGIEVSDSNHILVKGNSVNGALWGIRADNSPQVTIIANHAFNNFFPSIFIDNSHDDYILNNTADHTISDVNIGAWYSSNITLTGNLASYGGGGLSLYSDSYISVDSNRAWSGVVGLSVGNSNHIILSNNVVFSNKDGIDAQNCLDLNITRNAIFSNTGRGIYITGISQQNTLTPTQITQNTLVLNALGIQLDQVHGVHVNQNNMVNNTAQASDPILAQNAWDNNYPNGGNFWSDYQGVDNCSGPSQNICSGSDGIGDTAYNITTDVADRYPLVSPVQPPVNSDIAILSATADQIMRIQGQNGTITVEVQNNGAVPESFPVSAYFNGTLIGTITTIMLSSGHSQSLSFTWNTVTVIPGEYSLSVSAGPVAYEMHLSDNSRPIGIVRVIADTTPPSWPAGSKLVAQNVAMTSLTLSWTRASDDAIVLAYKVYSGTDLLANLPATSLTFNVTGLYPGTAYNFTVEAGDAGNNWSTDGPGVTVSTIADTTPPIWASNPTLTPSNISPDSLKLTWTPAPTDDFLVSSYRIIQDGSAIATIPASTNNYQVGGLKPNSTYTFRVEASDPFNNWSTNGPSTVATTMPSASVEIIINENALHSYYSPSTVTIGVGETVEWFNIATLPETVVSCGPSPPLDGAACPVLNEPSLPSFLKFIGVNQAFYFQFNVIGTYHYYDLYDSSARGTVIVTSFVPRGFLYINATYEGLPDQGSDLTITSNVHNEGNVQMQVTAINEVSDIGDYNFATSLPLVLNPGETKAVSIPFHIPLSTRVGNHSITITVQWSYYDPNAQQWLEPAPIVLQGHLLVNQAPEPNPGPQTPSPISNPTRTANAIQGTLEGISKIVANNLPSVILLIVAYIGIILAAIILVIRRERLKQDNQRLRFNQRFD